MIKNVLKLVGFNSAFSVNRMYVCIDGFHLGATVDLKHCGDSVTCQYCVSCDGSLTVLRSCDSVAHEIPAMLIMQKMAKERRKKTKLPMAHKIRTPDFLNTQRIPSLPICRKDLRRSTSLTGLAVTRDPHAF